MSTHTEDHIVILARIEENLSILEMAKLHMDSRAIIVINNRINELRKQLNGAEPQSAEHTLTFETLGGQRFTHTVSAQSETQLRQCAMQIIGSYEIDGITIRLISTAANQ